MSKCPVDHSSSINPKNNIPTNLDTQPEDQALSHKLSASRQTSTIPSKDQPSKFWQYPSMLQFYNALKRKGMQTDPEHIESMLFVHNHINELGWAEILKWEQKHPECQTPKLVSLKGLAHKQSIKSKYCELVHGTPKPFDRHDWLVDRCGKNVRYVIDYYHQDSNNPEDCAFFIDVRPALDSFTSIKDRILNFFNKP